MSIYHNPNKEAVRLSIKRGDLIRLLMACDHFQGAFEREGKEGSAAMWKRIHDELREVLDKHDEIAEAKGWR